MTIPTLDTNIGMLAYWKAAGVTEIQKADILPLLNSYIEYPEYVDGTIKIFDTGAGSSFPNNHSLVWVRVRSDGYVMAWLPQDFSQGSGSAGTLIETSFSGVKSVGTINSVVNGWYLTSVDSYVVNELCGQTLVMYLGDPSSWNGASYDKYEYRCLSIQLNQSDRLYFSRSPTTKTWMDHNLIRLGSVDYNLGDDVPHDVRPIRGSLVWWGHDSSTTGSPPPNTTRLGRAIYELWEELKTHQTGIPTTAQDLTGGGVYSGAFESGAVDGTAMDTDMDWVVDQWIGYVLHITSGACAGYYRIDDSAGTTVQCIDNDFSSMVSGNTYEILRLSTDHTLSYAGVNYYDYEFTSATKLFLFGKSGNATDYYYFTVPPSQTVYVAVMNFGNGGNEHSISYMYDAVSHSPHDARYTTNGYQKCDFTMYNKNHVGERQTIAHYRMYGCVSSAMVMVVG